MLRWQLQAAWLFAEAVRNANAYEERGDCWCLKLKKAQTKKAGASRRPL
jgi:hypothetical protein